jgi:protein-tyrosine phosphatase
MLFFSKKLPYLKDLIPPGYIDIHSHLLPGIDDGARSLEDTLVLVNSMAALGFEQCITTPHTMFSVWDNTAKTIDTALETSKSFLELNAVKMPLRAASEYLLDANFSEMLSSGATILTLKENYVLVEMSYINPPIQLYQILFDLQVAGYTPVLAHPERYSFYHRNFEEYDKLRTAGCKFQINLLSIVGYYGIQVAEIAKKLLKKDMIDFTGSDVHHQNHISAFSTRTVLKETSAIVEAMSRNTIFRF